MKILHVTTIANKLKFKMLIDGGHMCDFIPDKFGIVTENCTYDSFEKSSKDILNLSFEDIEDMHNAVRKDNPLDCLRFTELMEEV